MQTPSLWDVNALPLPHRLRRWAPRSHSVREVLHGATHGRHP